MASSPWMRLCWVGLHAMLCWVPGCIRRSWCSYTRFVSNTSCPPPIAPTKHWDSTHHPLSDNRNTEVCFMDQSAIPFILLSCSFPCMKQLMRPIFRNASASILFWHPRRTLDLNWKFSHFLSFPVRSIQLLIDSHPLLIKPPLNPWKTVHLSPNAITLLQSG